MHPVTIVGCGYAGSRLARRYAGLESFVRGFGSRAASCARIAAAGAEPALLDLDQPVQAAVDVEAHLVYHCVPPQPTGDGDVRLERLLDCLRGRPARLVYLSTTGVYGDRQGALVDEESVPHPKSDRAIRRLAAETRVRSWADAHGVSWCILRIPGIYGPGRLPLERLKRGEPAIVPAEATPGNRIHVEDLVSACVLAGIHPRAHRRIYNVTDGTEDSFTDYLQRVARLTSLPTPPLVSRAAVRDTVSAMAWSFLSESRRVDSRRMLDELGVDLAYRDLDAGIRASL